jgi:hypothetical protein
MTWIDSRSNMNHTAVMIGENVYCSAYPTFASNCDLLVASTIVKYDIFDCIGSLS